MTTNTSDNATYTPAFIEPEFGNGEAVPAFTDHVPPGRAETTAFGDGVGEGSRERELARLRAKGYAAGWAHGIRAAERAMQNQVAATEATLHRDIARNNAEASRTLWALGHAIDQTEEIQVPAAEELIDTVMRFAIDLAEAALTHEVKCATNPGRDALRRAMNAAAGQEVTAIRLNPDDCARLTPVDTPEGITIVPDASLQAGEAVVDHVLGSVEVLLTRALERARTELGLT